MRILAIDPGYERLGIAVIERQPRQNNPRLGDSAPPLLRGIPKREVLLYSACVRTPKELPHAERLLKIATEVRKIIDEFEPEGCAIETLFLAVNQKTVMPVAEARGAVLVEAARAGLAVYEYSPLQIKMAITGYGRSEKKQVTEMVRKLIVIPDEKSLASLPALREQAGPTRHSLLQRENTSLPPTFPKKWGGLPLLRENKFVRLDDEYDAIAIGLTCLASERNNRY